jgi:hypothetical protein
VFGRQISSPISSPTSFRALYECSRLLGLGCATEGIEPESLRKSLIDFAEQVVGFYKK